MENFKIGDKVKLSTGGPLMIIHEITPSRIYTTWFSKGDCVKRDSFPPVVLVNLSVAPKIPLAVVSG